MAKLEVSIENFDKVCASITRRGKALESDIQNALLLAVDFWHSHNRNPRYITQLHRAVTESPGISAPRLQKYIEYHVPVCLSKVKGEVKFVNDFDGTTERLADMLGVSWAQWRDPKDDKPEFDVAKWAMSVAKKARKEGVSEADAAKAFHDAWQEMEGKLAKAAAA